MPYLYIITTLLAFLVAQLTKFLIPSNNLKWHWKKIFAYSGMPSSHAAASVALSIIIGLQISFSSPLFAMMLFFTILIMRDAVGVRRYIGAQGEVINDLVKNLGDDQYLNQNYPKMKERVGHTKKQLLVGALIGLVVALIMNYF